MTGKGIKLTDNSLFCEKCGNDLSVPGSQEFVCHWDGTKEYGYKFRCTQCNAIFEVICTRTKEDAALWGDEDDN